MLIKIVLAILISIYSCVGQAQNMMTVNYAELEETFKAGGDSIKVVNFWATWCGPCMEEMPYFVEAQEAYKNERVKFVYVSMDFSSKIQKAEAIAKNKGLRGSHFLLKDNPNDFINKVDPNWEGQIPITLIVMPNGDFISNLAPFRNFKQLNKFIKPYLKQL